MCCTAPEDYLGLDVGVVNLTVDSDGTLYSGAAVERHRRIDAHRRRYLQRRSAQLPEEAPQPQGRPRHTHRSQTHPEALFTRDYRE